MSRYHASVCRLCRREGEKLFLKGQRCYSGKCALVHRQYAPGQHGQVRRKLSDFGLRLREKQKARRVYGLTERQFRRYFELARRQKGVTGENFLALLERRLDNVVYRLGFGVSRPQARQLVCHGHFLVGGRRTDVASRLLKTGQTIKVKPASAAKFTAIIEKLIKGEMNLPGWLAYDASEGQGKVVALPARSDIDTSLRENLIVEFYSR